MAFGENFLRDTSGSPGQARCLHPVRSGSQSQHSIWVILPTCRASHIIKTVYLVDSIIHLSDNVSHNFDKVRS